MTRACTSAGAPVRAWAVGSACTAAVLLLQACGSAGPVPLRRPLADPAQFGAAPAAVPPRVAGAASAPSPQAVGSSHATFPWPELRWWRAYGDAQLDRLVEQALSAQPSLAVAQARIEQARCPKPKQGNDLVMSCALAFIKAGAMENFLAGLETQDSPALQ